MLPTIEFKVCGQGNNPKAYNECEAFIKKWQKILRITDWEIGLSFLSGLEMYQHMGSEEYNASCARTTTNKSAMININTESPQINDELELTIIHELLHIVFDEYQVFTEKAVRDNDYALSTIKIKMEQTVESLAKSFVSFIKEGEKSDGSKDENQNKDN